MAVTERHYIHGDGRRCMWSSVRDGWLHWDHGQSEPGPREAREYRCNRDHYEDRFKDGPLPDDRGEFGMPGLGIGKVALLTDSEFEEDSDATVLMSVHPEYVILEDATQLRRVDAVTDDARFILSDVLPHLLAKFLRKNAQYARAQTGHDLGIKGIIPDINRKSAALITAVWDGGTIEYGDTDSAIDIAEDLVGHLLLFLAKTRES